MQNLRKAYLSIVFTMFFSNSTFAQPVPPLVADLPKFETPEDVQQALSMRAQASFPRDIGASTLSALLEMDGFKVRQTATGYTAKFQQSTFPCITDYILTWRESEIGTALDLRADLAQNCV